MNRKKILVVICFLLLLGIVYSFDKTEKAETYMSVYELNISRLKNADEMLLDVISRTNINTEAGADSVRTAIHKARLAMKAADIWLRYLQPLEYKKINSPLPVEWETEVFEKFEQPYKRDGSGLTLAELYLYEEVKTKDSLMKLVQTVNDAVQVYSADSVKDRMRDHNHFFLCNRLYLLNLAAIYSTGFECPDTKQVIPELRAMMVAVKDIYGAFNTDFPNSAFSKEYLLLYGKAIGFVQAQPADIEKFDHYSFIRDYINPLYLLNQQMINRYKIYSRNVLDYSLTKNEVTIFNKSLYNGQNPKGIFLRVNDEAALATIDSLGKLLFYDPLLSGNNRRSCASCHNAKAYFTDTAFASSLQFNGTERLPRNTPSLLNTQYNHLAMLDGKHISLQDQAKAVITNPLELNCAEKDVLEKILSCNTYRDGFRELLKYTPQEKEITFDHIVSAITYYYSKFSRYYSPFDNAMNRHTEASAQVRNGFNLFMSKAQCGTCHFVPQFNGVKPPYVGSEFEVLGVPADTAYKQLSPDKGRYNINPAYETMNAFRTGTVRNASYTKPYMHNGVFNTLEEVIDFYNGGGGAGRHLDVPNQTLSADSLKLTKGEKSDIIAFIQSLNEDVVFDTPPAALPRSKDKKLNERVVGGTY